MKKQDVTAYLEKMSVPTYGLGEPNKYPIFVGKRVYQGSSGKVYPVPFVDKVFQDDPPKDVAYQAAHLENEYVRLVMLPEIGGRIFIGQDRVNKDYDFFYRQDVIKPALVGLAGPWISGGVEFNWPQHHRPGTYMPADVMIEEGTDGSRTVWQSEHDPLNRLKGMHGICLRPGSSLIELKGRLYNRTAMTHTFLWWANVAARVHDQYQSFFPPDVHYVADHAVRAMSSFPVADGHYYGINYGERDGANDLSWYKNIPVPTSYMVCETGFNFFGGYDYEAEGGFVHVANKHISPGKKQWTWGNDEFGWAWDRELTDENGPYIELMAGVYTDNQPDFSYLLPYETKTFSQYWWPYQKIGPVQNANEQAAVRLVVEESGRIDLGLVVSHTFEGVTVVLRDGDDVVLEERCDVSPERPWRCDRLRFEGDDMSLLEVSVYDGNEVLISYRVVDVKGLKRNRQVATEPPMPEEIRSSDELFLTGEHLELYRHPTRSAELYWEEGLKRDEGDCRCNLAMGKVKLKRGEFDAAGAYLEKAMERLTFRHPNPVTGEGCYFLGLVRRYQGHDEEAYGLFYKSTWNYEWRSAGYYQVACLDVKAGRYDEALTHLECSLATNREHNKAMVLKAAIMRKQGEVAEAKNILSHLFEWDELDHWGRYEWALLNGGDVSEFVELCRNDGQTILDIAYDYAEAGLYEEAVGVLACHHGHEVLAVTVPNPLEKSQVTMYTVAWLYGMMGQDVESKAALDVARAMDGDFCFPSRVDEYVVLRWALEQEGDDRNAAYGLGNFCYDRERCEDAIGYWEQARGYDGAFAVVHRNLGIAYWNVQRDGEKARASYIEAMACEPEDSLLVSEYAQLCKKLGDSAGERLAFLEEREALVLDRDDCSVEMASLLNAVGRAKEALALLTGRRFHPWEGGEGKVLRQYTRAHLLLGEALLESGDAVGALEHFELAMQTPDSLGEKYHPLQAKADVTYWRGKALKMLGRLEDAETCFIEAANEDGDFQDMAVTAYSELTYYKGLSLIELGEIEKAKALFEGMKAWASEQKKERAKIDYFATSLPNLLVFDEDLDAVKQAAMDRLIEIALSF